MSLAKEREQLRSEISAFCKKLVLSQRAVELCEKEATPKQEGVLMMIKVSTKANIILFLFVATCLSLIIAFGLIPYKVQDDNPLTPERISQLRMDYPAYNADPDFVSMKTATFEEIIKEVESVIIGRVVKELPAYEVDLSPLLQSELREKEKILGISSKHKFNQYEIEVIQHISGKPVNKMIQLAYNAMYEGYEPKLKSGMKIVVGIASGSGVHQGKHFFTRSGTYYIVDDEYVLSVVDDEFSKQMNGHKVDRLIAKIKEIRN